MFGFLLVMVMSDGWQGGMVQQGIYKTSVDCQQAGPRWVLHNNNIGHPSTFYCQKVAVKKGQKWSEEGITPQMREKWAKQQAEQNKNLTYTMPEDPF
ncbi:hypothetical protein ACPRNU_25545, partial [Chromobacterium vaccinii]|uniref:hypothetical protein n=1 Tax=Chromobacterium vaccinii TaxID=1108595 RepID=UPI003C73ECEA